MSKAIKYNTLKHWNELANKGYYRRILIELNSISKVYFMNTEVDSSMDIDIANYINTMKYGVNYVQECVSTFHYYAYPRLLDKNTCLERYYELGILNYESLPLHVTNVMSLGLSITYLKYYFYHEDELDLFGPMEGFTKIHRPVTDQQIVSYWLDKATEDEIEYVRQNVHDRQTVLLFQPFLVKYL